MIYTIVSTQYLHWTDGRTDGETEMPYHYRARHYTDARGY